MKRVILTMFLIASFVFGHAQSRTLSGRVVDGGNEPLPGVSVVVKGTTTGTVTDANGQFSFTADNPTGKILAFSIVGFVGQEVEIGTGSVFNVTLMEDDLLLDEVVVVGYGVQKKKLLTGANANISGDEISELRTGTAMEALQGVTPGVQITRNHGAPGAGTKVTIRGIGTIGSASPLYIVDGVAVSNINYLNPSDIESLDVLKDAASAAIYGARAANGVILVTTKKGARNMKPNVTYDGYYGVQNMYRKPAVLNAQEYMYLFDEARINDGAEPYNWEDRVVNGNTYLTTNYGAGIAKEYGQHVWDKLQAGWTGTDWVDAVTMANAPMQSHSFNINGGKDDVTYAFGLSYYDQSGIIGGDITDAGYKRITARMNTEMVLFKNNRHDILTVGENITYNNSQNRSVGTGDIYWNDLHSAIVANPLLPLHYDKPELQKLTNGWAPTLEGIHRNLHNPVAQLYYRHNFNWSRGNSIIGNVYAVLEPVQDLKFRTAFGLNSWFGQSRSYSPVYGYADTYNRTVDAVSQSMYVGVSYTWTNTLTYDLRRGQHAFNFLLGSEMLKNVSSADMSASKAKTDFGLPEYAYLNNVSTVETVGDISASGSDWAAQGGGLLSYMARVSYNLAEKYMLDVVMRADGSSNFAKGNRWGYFPSFAAGWNFSEEDFMPQADWFTFGKLRASWGQNGNQSISNFIYLSNIAYLNQGYYFGPDKMASSTTAVPANIPNSNVKWETSEQINIGLDTRFFRSRLGFTVDLYQKTTKDWLVRAPILGTSGAGAPYINGGDIQNKGVELMLSWNDNVGDFKYGATVSGAFNKNEITRLANAEGIITGTTNVLAQNTGYVYRAEAGHAIGSFYGYKTDGIFQNQAEVDAYVDKSGDPIVIGSEKDTPRRPGDVRFVDTNGDGVIDDADKVYLGSPLPKFEAGLQLNAEYKGVYAHTTLTGKFGMQVMQSYRDFAGTPMENFPTSAMNRWHGEGTSDRLPRLSASTNANNSLVSDIYMHDADYVRIANLTVGYNFDKLLRNSNSLRGASAYVSFNNLHTFTKYDGMDPEVGYAPDAWASGIDLGLYPLARTVMFGVNLRF